MGCFDNKFDFEKFFVKLEIKINKYIVCLYIYEYEYEQLLYVLIKFFLFVKKYEFKVFKKYCKIILMLYKLFKMEIVIEKLLIINFRDKGKCFIEIEKINCCMDVQLVKMMRVYQLMVLLLDLLSEFGFGQL